MKASVLLLFTITCLSLFSHAKPEADSCTCNLNLKAPIPFDTSNLHCLPVWNAQGFILRVCALFFNLIKYIFISIASYILILIPIICSMLRLLQTFGASFSQLQTQILT